MFAVYKVNIIVEDSTDERGNHYFLASYTCLWLSRPSSVFEFTKLTPGEVTFVLLGNVGVIIREFQETFERGPIFES